jgi:hypothetical protein
MAITFEALAGILSINTRGWTTGLNQAISGLREFRGGAKQVFDNVGDLSRRVTAGVAAIGAAVTAMAASSTKDFLPSIKRCGAFLLLGLTSARANQAEAFATFATCSATFTARGCFTGAWPTGHRDANWSWSKLWVVQILQNRKPPI